MTPEQLLQATADLPAPLALVDRAALDANAADLVARAAGTRVRLATKSVRVRAVVESVLQRPGWHGLMTYSLAESNWLADQGIDDILLAYPTANAPAVAELLAAEHRRSAIKVMVDSVAGVDLLQRLAEAAGVPVTRDRPIRLCLDVDASLRIGSIHLGVRRSPVRTPEEAAAIAREIAEWPGFELVGVMFYDAQIAGLPDTSPAVRLVKRRSDADLRKRRSEVVAAVSRHAELELVNGGGTGSLEVTGADPAITELTAGSGLFTPTLFDTYDAFEARPAAFYALDVVRKPAPNIATCFSGGYIASGPAADSRLPRPVHPEGLKLIGTEGAGEVQTPVKGAGAADLSPGDRVLFRHAKAGEMCERFDSIALVGASVESVPTYRGEGKNFG